MQLDESKAIVEAAFAEVGFDGTGECAASELRVMSEVRDMCRADLCHSFDKSWSCPPACGTLEEFQAIIGSKQLCLAFQTVMQMEDSFDVETMIEAGETQAARVRELSTKLKNALPEALVLGSGTCVKCSQCTYPDAPCRFPDDLLFSMEAAGLLVNEVCTSCGIPYNHGENTICYTGCVLI